ncbi:MAG: hypothetical protein ABIO06_10595 [Pseudolysinimonas sp.]
MTDTEQNDANPEQSNEAQNDGEPTVVGVLGNAIRGFLPDAAAGRDVADDASGDEVPQDGDPGR